MTNKVTVLLEHYPSSITRLNTHLSTIRMHLKAIRTREESLSELKNRKRALASRIEGVEKKLAKMGPENKELAKTNAQLAELRQEMTALTQEVSVESAALGDFKRRSVHEALGIQCSALIELAEKLTALSQCSGAMLQYLDLSPAEPGMGRRPYQGTRATEDLLQDGLRALADVSFKPVSHASYQAWRHGGQQGQGYDAAYYHQQQQGQGQDYQHHPQRTLSADQAPGSAGAYNSNGQEGGVDPLNDYAAYAQHGLNGYVGEASHWQRGANGEEADGQHQQHLREQSSAGGNNGYHYGSSSGGANGPHDISSQYATGSGAGGLPASTSTGSAAGAGAAGVGAAGAGAGAATVLAAAAGPNPWEGGDAPAESDWGRAALGALDNASHANDAGARDLGAQTREAEAAHPPSSSTVTAGAPAIATTTNVKDGAQAGSTTQQQPHKSRDSLAEVENQYGRLTGAPVIANSVTGSADEHQGAEAAGTAPRSDPTGGEAGASAVPASAGAAAAADVSTASASAAQPGSASAVDQDEEALRAYFKSIGSTRAAQEAVRRPASAQGGGAAPSQPARYQAYNSAIAESNGQSSGAGSSAPSTVPGVGAIPVADTSYNSQSAGAAGGADDSGVKKVTAGAFRKGFARNVSSSNIQPPPGGFAGPGNGGSRPQTPSNSAVAAGGRPSAINTHVASAADPASYTSPTRANIPDALTPGGAAAAGRGTDDISVAPLHISKRASQDMGRYPNIISQTNGTADAAPPYSSAAPGPSAGAEAASSSRAENAYSVYGGMAPQSSGSQAPVAPRAQHQLYQDIPRPSSALAGGRPMPSPGGYRDPNAAGPGQIAAPSQHSHHSQPHSHYAQPPPPHQQQQAYYGQQGYFYGSQQQQQQQAPAHHHPQQQHQPYYGAPPPGAGDYSYADPYAAHYAQQQQQHQR